MLCPARQVGLSTSRHCPCQEVLSQNRLCPGKVIVGIQANTTVGHGALLPIEHVQDPAACPCACTAHQTTLLWRCYLAYELHRGRPESARRIMLRAVHACTWCKALWLDGIQALAHQVSEVHVLWAGWPTTALEPKP